jgi:hypothetical protein
MCLVKHPARLFVTPVVYFLSLHLGEHRQGSPHESGRDRGRLPSYGESVATEQGDVCGQARRCRPCALVSIEIVKTQGREITLALLERSDDDARQRRALRTGKPRRLIHEDVEATIILVILCRE